MLIGGSNFVAVRFSNAELPPYWGAALRFLPASMLLLAAMAIWRIPFPHGASLRGAAVYGALNFGLGYALTYYGLQDAPAGTGAPAATDIHTPQPAKAGRQRGHFISRAVRRRLPDFLPE